MSTRWLQPCTGRNAAFLLEVSVRSRVNTRSKRSKGVLEQSALTFQVVKSSLWECYVTVSGCLCVLLANVTCEFELTFHRYEVFVRYGGLKALVAGDAAL